MRSKSARRRARKRLARSKENIKKNSLSLGRAIVAQEWADIPELLPEMQAPANPLVLLTVSLLPGQAGQFVGDEVVVRGARDHRRMGKIEAGNVQLKAPQVPGLQKRIQEFQVTQGLEIGLP